jgi:hypothetical protein
VTDFAYLVPGDDDPGDTPENNVALIEPGPVVFDQDSEDVPVYDSEDPDGDRSGLSDPDFDPDEIEEVPTEDAPDPNMDRAVTDVPIEGGEGAAAPAEPKDG